MEPRKFSLVIRNSRLCKELWRLLPPEMSNHGGKKIKSQLYLSASLEEEKLRNTDADFNETKISLFISGNVKFMAGKD